MMSCGELVDILISTDVTRYLEFMLVSGSYVYRKGTGIAKVPSTVSEALSSPLMGFFEKRRLREFLEYVQGADPENPGTWGSHDLGRISFSALAKQKFNLEDGTVDFIGHAMALHLDDKYLNEPALDTIDRVRLYCASVTRYGKSPYIYPVYGLGELPQAFARLSAIYGGTYMLDRPIDRIVFDSTSNNLESLLVTGVESEGKIAHCKALFCDPSYVPEQCVVEHHVIRAICLLEHSVPGTGQADSAQLILPQRQLGREYDVYVAVVSAQHNVCPNGYWIAFVSTIHEEGQDPEKELGPAMAILGTVKEKFVWLSPMLKHKNDNLIRTPKKNPFSNPVDEKESDGIVKPNISTSIAAVPENFPNGNLFVSRSYDATSHFETVCADVKRLYEAFRGKPLKIKRRMTVAEEEKLFQQQTTNSKIEEGTGTLNIQSK